MQNEKVVNFTVNHLYQYLMIISPFPKEYVVKTKYVKRTLFKVHQERQEGNLYT
jgi:hypothetical protein